MVDYNENMLKDKVAKKSSKTRRAGKKTKAVAEKVATVKAPKEEVVKEQETPTETVE